MTFNLAVIVTEDGDQLEFGIDFNKPTLSAHDVQGLGEMVLATPVPRCGNITHATCGGCVDSKHTTSTMTTFSCRYCNFRINVPNTVVTVGGLRTYFARFGQ